MGEPVENYLSTEKATQQSGRKRLSLIPSQVKANVRREQQRNALLALPQQAPRIPHILNEYELCGGQR